METIKLSVAQRQARGKGAMGRLRRSGSLPGVFYGPGKDAIPVCINAREFERKVEDVEGSHLIQLSSEATDLDEKIVLLKEVQHHPVDAAPVHVDFYEVDIGVPLQVNVPIHLVGKAKGVTAGGTLQHFRRDILVECLPLEIPEIVEVDVTELDIHDAVRVADVSLPSGVTVIEDAQLMLASVVAPTVSEQDEEEGAAADGTEAADAEEDGAEARPAE